MAIVTILVIETVRASSQFFWTRTGYRIQRGSCKVASLIFVIDAQVAKTVTSLLELFPSFIGSGHLVA